MHPETKAGVAGAKAKHGSANENSSFAAATAIATGRNKRTIEIAASRGAALGDDLEKIVGTFCPGLAKQPLHIDRFGGGHHHGYGHTLHKH